MGDKATWDTRKARREYGRQRQSARHRGIGWELTFEQWWQIWQDSGRYAERGPKCNQFVMARKWDRGPYAIGNVEIQTAQQNHETRRLRRMFRSKVGSRRQRIMENAPDVIDVLEAEEEAA